MKRNMKRKIKLLKKKLINIKKQLFIIKKIILPVYSSIQKKKDILLFYYELKFKAFKVIRLLKKEKKLFRKKKKLFLKRKKLFLKRKKSKIIKSSFINT